MHQNLCTIRKQLTTLTRGIMARRGAPPVPYNIEQEASIVRGKGAPPLTLIIIAVVRT